MKYKVNDPTGRQKIIFNAEKPTVAFLLQQPQNMVIKTNQIFFSFVLTREKVKMAKNKIKQLNNVQMKLTCY